MYFDELAIEDALLDSLDAMHFEECTPVQEAAIPIILEGKDVIACAQTGTGKTAAYILPLLNNLLTDKATNNHDEYRVNAIIMAPTRELAQQIDRQMEGFSFYLPFSSVAVYGGNDGGLWDVQKRGLTHGADVVIATPGRLLSHTNVYKVDFSAVRYFILDEADRMLDMGFYDDIMKIVAMLPKERQTIMFSATMPDELRRLAKTIMHEPEEVNIAISRPPETIRQMAVLCYDTQKQELLRRMLAGKGLKKVLVFVGKKQRVKDVWLSLRKAGLEARQIHSDLEQQERDKVMLDFRNGKVDVLVATDIVSRGIDVDDIPLVVNYDVPRDVEDYVHRIGRTARAEQTGRAVSLVSEADQFYLQRIEQFLGYEIERVPLPKEMGEAPEWKPKKDGGKGKNGKTRPKGKKSGKSVKKTKNSQKKTQKFV